MNIYDVIIIGGSYAGLSAAMALGRSRRNILVVDAGDPCNKPTPHTHNFLTQDGVAPAEIATIARHQVLKYPGVHWLQGRAFGITPGETYFELALDAADHVRSRKVILATGLRDLLPTIPGFNDCWGKTIIHCPYCHGYEYSNEKTGILASADEAFEMVKLISNWTDDLKLFLINNDNLSGEHQETMRKKGVQIVKLPISEVIHEQGRLKHLITEDGSEQKMSALYARLPTEQKAKFVEELGLTAMPYGHIEVDMFGKTSIEGIYAVGDCAHPMRSVATAAYTGHIAGAMINKELIEEDYLY